MDKKKTILRQAKIALARKNFYFFCCLMFPNIYLEHRWHLKLWADSLQNFFEGDKIFWMLNGPPRHGKSLTGQLFCAWYLGLHPEKRILVLAYNKDVAEIYGGKVKEVITREKYNTDDIVYSDIFPDTTIKYGSNAAAKWSIKGNSEVSFLSASLSSTITSMGFDVCIVDDMIQGPEEARNERQLKKDYENFKNTVLSRIEGAKDGSKGRFLITMTRWATGDICGRFLQEKAFADKLELMLTKAIGEDGEWIAPDMLSLAAIFSESIHEDIFLANYQQEPIDIKNRLYSEFRTYTEEDLPKKDKEGKQMVYMTELMIDTADRGSDFYCAIWYIPWRGKIYVKDIFYTQEKLSKLEDKMVDLIIQNNTMNLIGEGNNGGSIHIENLKKEYKRKGKNRCRFSFYVQNKNKESRINAQAKWVEDNIYFPEGWEKMWTQFYKDIMTFQSDFKANQHDDCADCLTAIADRYNGSMKKGLTIIR